MSLKKKLSDKLLNTYAQIKESQRRPGFCLVGFDGFTDEILKAINTRYNDGRFETMQVMQEFGERILGHSGKSCNIELTLERKKLGGNAPILAQALLEGGHRLVFVGPIGNKEAIEPLFQKMAESCEEVYTLGPSAHTDAIEFADGKVILGKLQALAAVTYENILRTVGRDHFIELLDKSDLLISANWTMLPMMTGLWEKIATEFSLSFKQKKKRAHFIDFADPAKRTDEDLLHALETLQQLSPLFQTTLGLNRSEGERLCRVIGGDDQGSDEKLAAYLQNKLQFHTLLLHSTHSAVGAREGELQSVKSAFTPTPLLKTGAGDHFNAGFCNGYLYGFSLEEALLSGVATSGFYVRTGHSPSMLELAQFLNQWEEG